MPNLSYLWHFLHGHAKNIWRTPCTLASMILLHPPCMLARLIQHGRYNSPVPWTHVFCLKRQPCLPWRHMISGESRPYSLCRRQGDTVKKKPWQRTVSSAWKRIAKVTLEKKLDSFGEVVYSHCLRQFCGSGRKKDTSPQKTSKQRQRSRFWDRRRTQRGRDSRPCAPWKKSTCGKYGKSSRLAQCPLPSGGLLSK